mgnify:CR=1 FL=1
MTAKKTRSSYWRIYSNKVRQYSLELMQPTQMMSPGSHPAVPGASPNASSHIPGLCTKRSIDLDTASLEVESSSVTIDDAYATWHAMDSVGRKCTPLQNDSE